jgi:hypothetical protein
VAWTCHTRRWEKRRSIEKRVRESRGFPSRSLHTLILPAEIRPGTHDPPRCTTDYFLSPAREVLYAA